MTHPELNPLGLAPVEANELQKMFLTKLSAISELIRHGYVVCTCWLTLEDHQ